MRRAEWSLPDTPPNGRGLDSFVGWFCVGEFIVRFREKLKRTGLLLGRSTALTLLTHFPAGQSLWSADKNAT